MLGPPAQDCPFFLIWKSSADLAVSAGYLSRIALAGQTPCFAMAGHIVVDLSHSPREEYEDLVSPEASPAPEARPADEAPVPQVDEGADEAPVPQVDGGGPAPKEASKGKLALISIFSSDFFPAGIPDVVGDDGEMMPGTDLGPRHIEKICAGGWCLINENRSVPTNQPLDFYVRPFVKAREIAWKMASFACHSMPYRADAKVVAGDPGQLLSFSASTKSALGAIPFPVVAQTIRTPLVSNRKKSPRAPPQEFRVLYLGFCQGHHMLPLLKDALEEGGIMIYYGDQTEKSDEGVASYVIQEFLETLMEALKEEITAGGKTAAEIDTDCLIKLFKGAYASVGLAYLGPQEKQMEKEASGDYKYATLFLDQSQNAAEKLPGYVCGHMFAGNLNAVVKRDGVLVPLVDPDLKAERVRFMAEKQREIDRAASGGSPGGGGKRRRA